MMNDKRPTTAAEPTRSSERYQVLDVLRGLALSGIALANFPEFALWTFLSTAQQALLPTAQADRVVRFVQYFLIDGKFYTIFSLLFGVGFALILQRHGRRLFLRRMVVLAAIGTLHLLFVWSGDILLLYAVGGMLLLGLSQCSSRVLLWLSAVLLLLPVGLDALTEFGGIQFAAPFYRRWWQVATAVGISESNFATWLRDAHSYREVFAFLQQGACERIWEFVEGHRLPKVLSLFVLGYLAGRHRLYARCGELPLVRVLAVSAAIGVPASLLYACSAVGGRPWGLTVHSLLYAVSVVLMALAYVTGLTLWHQKHSRAAVFAWLQAPGRMALSCYIGQSFVGIALFYGIGLGLGATFGLVWAEAAALVTYVVQAAACTLWLRWLRFGPLEWVWRMLTYGRYFPLFKRD